MEEICKTFYFHMILQGLKRNKSDYGLDIAKCFLEILQNTVKYKAI